MCILERDFERNALSPESANALSKAHGAIRAVSEECFALKALDRLAVLIAERDLHAS